MEAVLLISIVAAVFIFSYFIMKKLDIFLRDGGNNSKKFTLYIAFEMPVLIDFISDLFEDFLNKNPYCEFCLFFGSADDIEKSMETGKIDFAFLITEFVCSNKEYSSITVPLRQKPIISSAAGIAVKPLGKEEIIARAVWKKNIDNHEKELFAEQLNHCLI